MSEVIDNFIESLKTRTSLHVSDLPEGYARDVFSIMGVSGDRPLLIQQMEIPKEIVEASDDSNHSSAKVDRINYAKRVLADAFGIGEW